MTRRAWVRSAGSGLAANRLVREGFEKPLCAEILIPFPRELLVLLVEAGKTNVVLPVPVAGILLHAEIVISEILCEAPDYVELKPDTWRALSI